MFNATQAAVQVISTQQHLETITGALMTLAGVHQVTGLCPVEGGGGGGGGGRGASP